jgi:uncharacterized membrane protein YoaK (UPF0700 family)
MMASGKWVLWSMLTLSFSTGVLDAATYLGLHGVFTANMTGNLILVSLGVTGQASIPVLRAFLALGGFAMGAAAAGRLLRAGATRPPSETRICLAVLTVGLLLAGSSLVLFLGAGSTWLLDSLTVVLAFAMGAQAIAARRVGVGDVTTVVVTSTLAGLMGENPVTGRSADGALTGRRALAVATMGLGAVTGALLMLTSVEVAVAVSALLTLAVAGVLAVRSRGSNRPDPVPSLSRVSWAPSLR